ncbi:MAG TPA: choice-of-anchor D domain-containing protein [Ktedonobacteraceae bacterium]
METIRCPRCQKMLRVDARSCGRCGLALPEGRPSRRRGIDNGGDTGPLTSPPASPHRAGHYTGLHPEDQPFQSSFFLRVERPLAAEPEPTDIDVSTVLHLEDDPPTSPSYPARPPLVAEYDLEEEHAPEYSALADLPTLPRRSPNTPLPETLLPPAPPQARTPPGKLRIIQVLVSTSLICFLLATGLLAFLLLGKNQGQAHVEPPRLMALPGEVRVGDVLQLSGRGFDARSVVALTYDAGLPLLDAQGRQVLPTTDAQGAFQIHIPVTTDWKIGAHSLQASEGQIKTSTVLTIQAALPGTPSLQLGLTRLDLGSGQPGTRSQKTLTLTNTGGGRVSWSARSSDAWLTLMPASGSFAGSMVVQLMVDRTNLAPQSYLSHVDFTQEQGTTQTLHVSMTVNTTSACLALSTASLAFAGTPAQSPAGQTIVIQNNGGQPLNWSSDNTTSDGGSWLSVTPASGLLPANTSAVLTVNVITLNMAVNTYQGALSFSYAGGQTQQVAISLNVTPPPQPAMHLSQQSLSFATNQGINPRAQSVTIANPGNAPLDWTIQSDLNGQIYLQVTPASGSVAPGQSVSVSIAPHPGSADGTISSKLIVMDSDAGTTVPSQQIAVSIAITAQPIIMLNASRLDFAHSASTTNSTALLIITDNGSLPLNWTLATSAPASWLSFDNTSGSLAPGKYIYVNVRCLSTSMKPGTYTATIIVKDSDAGSVAAPQSVTVTLVIT